MRRARPGDRGRLDRSGNPHRLGDHGTLEVRFGPLGEIVRVEGERYRDVDGEGVRTPFVGHFRVQVDGMQTPCSSAGTWSFIGIHNALFHLAFLLVIQEDPLHFNGSDVLLETA